MTSLNDTGSTAFNSSGVRDIQVGRKERTFRDRVGGSNLDDYFRFQLNSASSLNIHLSRLKANADIAVIDAQGHVMGVSARPGKKSEGLHLDLAPGTYYIRVHATSGSTSFRLGVSTRSSRNNPTAAASDDRPVIDWNAVLLKAIVTDKTAPPLAARNMAIVQTAIFDAVNSILRLSNGYRVNYVSAPIGASPEAAVSGAAYRTLSYLFPSQQSTFDAELSQELAKIPNGSSKNEGFSIGVTVANEILSWRDRDQSNITVAYTPLNGSQYWQPTPSAFASALLPQWPHVTPFGMTSGAQFRPVNPPDFNGAQYAAELAEVQSVGQNNSTTRTADQTQIALFWADGSGTYTPPGHWNDIAQQVSRSRRRSLFEDARLFAVLDIALADAGIAAWDAKYAYNQVRPITAIRQSSDPTWTPLITTPPFPDYISGHSTFSGAASKVLGAFFGDNISFTTTSMGMANVYRSYSSFSTAADEAGKSRIYGGIHVQNSNLVGLTTGQAIADYILRNMLMV